MTINKQKLWPELGLKLVTEHAGRRCDMQTSLVEKCSSSAGIDVIFTAFLPDFVLGYWVMVEPVHTQCAYYITTTCHYKHHQYCECLRSYHQPIAYVPISVRLSPV